MGSALNTQSAYHMKNDRVVWEERDPRLFAVTIQKLLASPEERRWLGEQGRRRFEEHFSNATIEGQLAAALGLEATRPAAQAEGI